MSNPTLPKLQSLGAHRFAGNISLATSASDIFAHVREMMDSAATLATLKDSFAATATTIDGKVLDPRSHSRLQLASILEAVATGERSNRAKLWESFAQVRKDGVHGSGIGSGLPASRLLPFLYKVKVELETERGIYKRFLDVLAEYGFGRISNMNAMVSVFGLLYHRHELLSEQCRHVLIVSDIPKNFSITKTLHSAKLKVPPKKQRIASSEECRLRLAINILPVFHPNGIHSPVTVPPNSSVVTAATQLSSAVITTLSKPSTESLRPTDSQKAKISMSPLNTQSMSQTPNKQMTSTSTPNSANSTFQSSVRLPAPSLPSDPPFTKEGRINAGYIMNALLNHKYAERFRDTENHSGTSTGATNSPNSSTLSTITDIASTSSLAGITTPKITTIPHYNLSRMSERLKEGGYPSHFSFRRDFDGIIQSCRECNMYLLEADNKAGENNGLSWETLAVLEFELVAAHRLEKYFMNEWTYFFPELSGKRRGRANAAMDAGTDLEAGGNDKKKAKW
ncbi:UNVERIFIED_CONTAM: hypothetical protein HDU68_003941 [Siphonaria sp. JEL0065]|nr:hypothetical protein HDU68_003941 [Siphonaria sp. JEL0065]